MIGVTWGIGIQWLTDLCSGIIKQGGIPEDWKLSMVLPIYKGKGDPMEYGSCNQRDKVAGACHESG